MVNTSKRNEANNKRLLDERTAFGHLVWRDSFVIISKSRYSFYTFCAVLFGLSALGVVLFFFAPDQYSFYPRCLFHSLTGWQCPGCGGLRATNRLLHGDLAGAFRFNPLLVSLLPVLLVLAVGAGLKNLTGRDWLRRFRHPLWLWFFLALVALFSIGRNLPLN
jgi:hypothetical protein